MLNRERQGGEPNHQKHGNELLDGLGRGPSFGCDLKGVTGLAPGFNAATEVLDPAMKSSTVKSINQLLSTLVGVGNKHEIVVWKLAAQQQAAGDVMAAGNVAAPIQRCSPNINQKWGMGDRRPLERGTQFRATE